MLKNKPYTMHQTIKKIAPKEALNQPEQPPITTIDMNHVAVYCRDNWIIKDKKGATVAFNFHSLYCPQFIPPAKWLKTEVYQVELLMQEKCANKTCDYSCNGCTAKTTMVDMTNNFVTILKYL